MRHVSEVAQGMLWLDGKHLNQDVQGCPHTSQIVKDVIDSFAIYFVVFVNFFIVILKFNIRSNLISYVRGVFL